MRVCSAPAGVESLARWYDLGPGAKQTRVVAHAEQADLVEGLRLERVLGRGAHSVVWSAHSLSDAMPWRGHRELVVKLALDSSVRNTALLRREARVLARLRSAS